MDKNILAVALGSMLLGGVAVASYNSFTAKPAAPEFEPVRPAMGATQLDASANAGAQLAPAALAPVPQRPQLEYADVIDVDPVTKKVPLYATVTNVDPIRETASTSVPREVCEDIVVQERLPERDGNYGGTIAGAVVGGLLGSRVGDGNGRKAATAAGAVAGGFIGNRMDRRHVGGQVVARTDRQCRTVMDTQRSSRTVAYDVTYRNPDGSTDSRRMESRPGKRISLGSDTETIGYDVTYRYQGSEETIRMSERPGSRLPVVDGQVMASAALASRG